MTSPYLRDDALWKKVEEERSYQSRIREPYLLAFRELPEEVALRGNEDVTIAKIENEFHRFAEELARDGREGVRFERYLIRKGFYPGFAPHDPVGFETSYSAAEPQ